MEWLRWRNRTDNTLESLSGLRLKYDEFYSRQEIQRNVSIPGLFHEPPHDWSGPLFSQWVETYIGVRTRWVGTVIIPPFCAYCMRSDEVPLDQQHCLDRYLSTIDDPFIRFLAAKDIWVWSHWQAWTKIKIEKDSMHRIHGLKYKHTRWRHSPTSVGNLPLGRYSGWRKHGAKCWGMRWPLLK